LFFNVSQTELPIFIGLVDPSKKPLALFLFGKMEKKFYDPRPIAVEMGLQVEDRPIALLPNILFVSGEIRQSLGLEQFRMNPDDQHFFVVRTVEDADTPAFGEAAQGAP
jgi:hypothetical protein